jgi:AraC-like DNA-binding protein
MTFEFTTGPDFVYVHSFAKALDVKVSNNTLLIPSWLGEGTIRYIDQVPDCKITIHRYKLKEELVVVRKGAHTHHDMVSIILNCNESPASLAIGNNEIRFSRKSGFAIQISSTDLNSVYRYPANMEVNYTVIGIRVSRLSSMLQTNRSNSTVRTILDDAPGFLVYENMWADVEKKLSHLKVVHPDNGLADLYFNIRVDELVYLIFERLLQRDSKKHSPVNASDIEKIFLIRAAILSDLSMPPRLSSLANMAALSETKMKDLFKQVFGDGIYSYFQKARMEEAAFLLKHGGCSVSEAGFRLGFINLSHFSRLFRQHYGVNPKKYSSL